MGKRLTLLYFLLTALIVSPILGQHYISNVQSFGMEEGLSGRIATCFFKDSQGLMWIGTQHGLNRFDGYEFKVYSKESHGLHFNQIAQVEEDDAGMLWVLYDKAFGISTDLEVFNPKKEKALSLAEYLIVTELPFSTTEVAHLSNSTYHGLIITLQNGDLYAYRNNTLLKIASVLQKTGSNIIEFYPLPNGGGWLLSSFVLTKISKDGKILDRIEKEGRMGKIVTIDNNEKPLYTYFKKNTYLYLHQEKIIQLPKDTEDIIGIDKSANRVYVIRNSSGGSMLAVTDTLGNIIEEQASKLSFKSGNLQFFEPEIWIGKLSGGMMLVQTHQTKFRKYIHDRKTLHGYNYGARGMHLLQNGKLLTNGGSFSYIINLQNGDYEQFATNLPFYKKPKTHFSESLSILEDNQGNLWLTDENTRLLYYQTSAKTFKEYNYSDGFHTELAGNHKTPKLKVKPLLQWSLHEDDNHKIWIGHQNGLSYLNRTTEQLEVFQNYQGFEELQESTVYNFHQNKKGTWLATTSGIYLFDTNGEGKVKSQFHENGDAFHKLPHNHIAHIYEDGTGVFWLASKGGGLIRWNPDTGKNQQFTTKNGLSDNVVYAVYEDDYNHLWLSSNQGIMRFDKLTHEVNTYLPKDGITHEEFNTISHLQTPDGTIYFGGLNGITSFHPKDFIQNNQDRFPIRITNVSKRDGETGELSEINQATLANNSIVLSPSDLGFQLQFAYMNFRPNETTYAYQIQGLDKDWNYTTQPNITINYLPAGNYILLLKAQGAQGNWSRSRQIKVIQQAPFYRQSWFLWFVVTSSLLVIFFFFRFRSYQHRKKQKALEQIIKERTETISQQNEELQSLDKLKSKFFANISHELRTPLTLILAPASQLQEIHQDKKSQKLLWNIQKNGEHLRQMVNEILDLSKLDAQKLALHESAVSPQIYFMNIFEKFESEALLQGVSLNINNQLPDHYTLLIDAEKVERVVMNLLSNAIKFTPKGGIVSLDIWKEEAKLFVSVKDSGIGISAEDSPHVFERYFQSKSSDSPAQGGTGIGLALAKELSQFMEGELVVKSKSGKGSRFTLWLPLKIATQEATGPSLSSIDTLDTEEEKILIPLKNGVKPTILLVEDTLEMQDFIADLLEDECKVTRANNGLEAIYELEKGKHLPDFILTDAMMPKMDGFGLMERVKANSKWKSIPTLMLTARTAEKARIQAFTIGVNDYMNKPFSPKELKVRIANLLQFSFDRIIYQQENKTENKEPSTKTLGENIPEADWAWISSVEKSIQSQIGNSDFSLKEIAQQHKISERQFQRKVKQITGLTPIKYQQEIQLQTSRDLIESNAFSTVKEVAQQTGFKDSHYFSVLFKKRFGKKPSEYL